MKWPSLRPWQSARLSRTRKARRRRRERAVRPGVEELGPRLAPAVAVNFSGSNLSITDPSPATVETVAISQATGGILQLDLNNNTGSDVFTTSSAGVSLTNSGTTALVDTGGTPIAQLVADLTQQGDTVLFNTLTAPSGVSIGSIDVQQATKIEVTGSLTLTGAGGVTLNATNPTSSSGGIVIDPGAGITTDAGNILLTGQSSIDGSNVYGVFLRGGSLTTNTGNITLTGTSGGLGVNNTGDEGVLLQGSGSNNAVVTSTSGSISITGTGGGGTAGGASAGVAVLSGSLIQLTGTSTTASITLTGTGGFSGSEDDGVLLQGSTVTAQFGAIQITGTGGGNGTNDNCGVALGNGAQVTSTGTVLGSSATITINGLGGDGAQDNQGVRMIGNPGGPTTEVVSAEGSVTITGTGGNGTAGQNHNNGIQLEAGAVVQSTDQATLSLFGSTGQTNDSDDVGVELTDPGTLVTATFGDIDIEGIGPDFGTGDNNLGVLVQDGAQVSSTGVGAKVADILIAGTGGVGDNNGYGIELLGSAAGTPAVTTVDGAITLFGSGDGVGNNNVGVYLSKGVVQSTGTGSFGTIVLNGASCGCGVGGNSGVVLDSSSLVTSVDAPIDVEGFGAGSGAGNDGIVITQSTIDATGSGDVTVHGQAALSGGTGVGVLVQHASTVGKDGSGAVKVEGVGVGAVDIQWDGLTIHKTGGSYTFDGSTLCTVGLTLQSGPYTAAVNAGALGITFLGLLEVDQGVSLTFTAPSSALLGTLTTVLGQIVAANGVQVGPGLLRGTGDVNAPLDVTAGGTVAPGLAASTGILTGSGATTFEPGSTFAVRLDGLRPGAGYDQLDLTDPTITGSTLDLSVATKVPLGTTFTILHSLTPIVGTFGGLPQGAVFERDGQLFRITYRGAGDDIVLTMIAEVNADPPGQPGGPSLAANDNGLEGLDIGGPGLAPGAQLLLGTGGTTTPTGNVAVTGSSLVFVVLRTGLGATENSGTESDTDAEGLITGAVNGGKFGELAGQPVVLEQLVGSTWAKVRQTTLDGQGTFYFAGAPAGIYRVAPHLNMGRLVPEWGDGLIRLSPKGQAHNRLKLQRPTSQAPRTAPLDQVFASWPGTEAEGAGVEWDEAEESAGALTWAEDAGPPQARALLLLAVFGALAAPQACPRRWRSPAPLLFRAHSR